MAASDLTATRPEHVENGRALPSSIRPAMNLSPNEMRALKALTGRSLTELIGGDPNDMDLAPDRIQAMTWVALKRAGYAATWEQSGDVIPDMTEDAPAPDPYFDRQVEQALHLCRYWHMSPLELERLDPEMREAMTEFVVKQQRAERRANRRAAKRRG